MKHPLKSRKWWLSLISAIVPILNHAFGLDLDVGEVAGIVAPLMLWVICEFYRDAKREGE